MEMMGISAGAPMVSGRIPNDFTLIDSGAEVLGTEEFSMIQQETVEQSRIALDGVLVVFGLHPIKGELILIEASSGRGAVISR